MIAKIFLTKIAAVGVAACLLAIAAAGMAAAHEPRGIGDYRLVVGFAQEPAFEGLLNGVSLRVTKPADGAAHSGDGGGHAHGGNAHGGDSHGNMAAMSHDGAIALDDAVSVALEVDVDDDGGVNVRILTDNWRWSPENVNGAHIAGEGHAHIYADGVKLNRVYGPRYHIAGLEAGEREIRVTLNANSHNELRVNGEPLEAALTVNVPDAAHTHKAHTRAAAAADGAMSIDAMAHPDAPGEYNLQVATSGFAFGDGNGGGDGYGLVSIDGEAHARMYEAWHKLPKLDAGEHTIGVALVNNENAPYAWQGAPVEASVVVHIAEDGGEAAQAGAAMAGMGAMPSMGAMAMAMDDADMVAVEGLAATLQVEVTHMPTGASRVMALHAVRGDAGHYLADFIPTASGQYSFHFTGSIEGVAVDERFESGADTFANVEPATAIQFPDRAASAREVEAASRGAIETAQQALSLSASAGGAADSARMLGIVGIVVGAAGVVVGGAALLATRRRQ